MALLSSKIDFKYRFDVAIVINVYSKTSNPVIVKIYNDYKINFI